MQHKSPQNNFSIPLICLRLSFLGVAILGALCLPTHRLEANLRAETRVVTEIAVQYSGLKNVSEDVIRSHLQTSPGALYNQNAIDRSIENLNATGLFEDIQVGYEELDSQGLRLVFMVSPRYTIRQLKFAGNKRFKRPALLKQIKSFPKGPLNQEQLHADIQALESFYRLKKGFPNAKVEKKIHYDRILGCADITLEIQEGARVRITQIQFTGNQQVSSKKLRKLMKTRKRGLFSLLTGAGKFKRDEFENDLKAIQDYYRNQGFLDVSIPEEGIIYQYPTPQSLQLCLPIQEGRRHYLGHINLLGNRLFSKEELLTVTRLKPGNFFSPQAVEEATEAIQDHYGKKGYLDTAVKAHQRPAAQPDTLDLHFSISEGKEIYVESVKISGNTKTKSRVILREVSVLPGDVFDMVQVKASEQRLRSTRYFSDVTLTAEEINVPGRRNLNISVKEGQTGGVSFGGAFNTLDKVLGIVELTQSNFDLFNARSFFQGAGQKFRLRLSVGARSNEILVNWENPAILDRKLALGVEAFRQEIRYNSTLYNQSSYGGEVYLRKNLVELIEGTLAYRLEKNRIFGVKEKAPRAIKREEGTRTASRISSSLLRDTRNAFIMPSEGNRSEATLQLNGGPMGGNTHYWRMEGRSAQFWPISENRHQVLSLLGSLGALTPFRSKEVPIFDRYYLGGAQSLRGFPHHGVSPKVDAQDQVLTKNSPNKELAEPIGGNSFAMGSVEYNIDLIDPLVLALYYDWGFVNRKKWDFSPSHYNDNWGIGFILPILGTPLRLDFGFPITTDGIEKKRMNFEFSFGVRF